jgi:hypothetical protein
MAELKMNPNDRDIPEAVSQTWFTFLASTDSKLTAPVIIGCIARSDPSSGAGRTELRGLLWALQLYVGPLGDRKAPENPDDIDGLKRSTEVALAWWEKNKLRSPTNWLLNTLAGRGYQTRNPADVRGTADALLSALESPDVIESHAAAVVLASVLPDGGSLVIERSSILRRPDPNDKVDASIAAMRNYLKELLICRGSHWRFFESASHRWNALEGKYERIEMATRSNSKSASSAAPPSQEACRNCFCDR